MVACVRWSQLVYLGLLAVCLAIDPGVATHRDEGGLSNFGIHVATVVPYTGAFAGAAILLLAGARAAPVGPAANGFARWCRVLAVALLCVLASTYAYKRDVALHDLHIAVSVAASALEVALGAWLVGTTARDATTTGALVLLAAAALLGVITLAGGAHLLFVAQAVGAVAFAVVLVRGAAAVARAGRVEATG